MQKSFPELTILRVWVENNDNDAVTSLPDSFLGGTAPLLRLVSLDDCPFPGIPKLLLSADQLVALNLWNIPESGHISPQDLVAVMSRLESLNLGFKCPQYPASRPRPPLSRSVLPALTRLVFKGVQEYLEDLLAQIDAPLINNLEIIFFMDLDFVVPQLHRLIDHAGWFKTCDRAIVRTSDHAIQFSVLRDTSQFSDLLLEISCRRSDWQLASLAQVCSSSFPLLPTLVRLNIADEAPQSHDVETTQWLELLDPFTAVKDLHLSNQVARHVCQALEELAEERATEFLPALQSIFLRGLEPLESVPKNFEGFVSKRKLSGRPVAVHCSE